MNRSTRSSRDTPRTAGSSRLFSGHTEPPQAALVWPLLSGPAERAGGSQQGTPTRKMDHLRGGGARDAHAGGGRCSPALPRSFDGAPRLRVVAVSSPRSGSHRSRTHDRDRSRSRSKTAARTPGSSAGAEPLLSSLNRPSSPPPAGELWTSHRRCVTLPIARVGCAPLPVFVPTNKKLRPLPELFFFPADLSIPPHPPRFRADDANRHESVQFATGSDGRRQLPRSAS